MIFKICEGISCFSFYVKEFDVIVHKTYFFLYNHIEVLTILYLKSLANPVVEVRSRHSQQILFCNAKHQIRVYLWGTSMLGVLYDGEDNRSRIYG